MTTPTGRIQTSDVNAEMGRPWNQAFSFNDPAVRALAQVLGDRAPISMASMRGRSSYTPMTLTGSGDYGTSTTWGGSETTVSCYPSVAVAGGAGPFTYEWVFVRGSFPMSGADTNRPRVYTSVKYRYYGDAELQVTVRDSRGNAVTIRGITVALEVWPEGEGPR